MTSQHPANEPVQVRLPAELPTLTTSAARVLLGILVELTETPVLEATPDDR
jgi:hypothetical protein